MGDGTFTDVSELTNLGRVTATLVGFGTKFMDFDNDGNLDLFVANGHVQDENYRQRANPTSAVARSTLSQ